MPIALISVAEVMKTTMPRTTARQMCEPKAASPPFVEVDLLVVNAAELTGAKPLAGRLKVVGNDGIRLLQHHHLTGDAPDP